MPPLPNTLYTRDTTCGSTIWWGDPEQEWGLDTLEGGDVMPAGNGVVLVGMSERSSRQAITQMAASLFASDAAERVIVAGMPKLRAAMHLDTDHSSTASHTFTLRPSDKDPVESPRRRSPSSTSWPSR